MLKHQAYVILKIFLPVVRLCVIEWTNIMFCILWFLFFDFAELEK